MIISAGFAKLGRIILSGIKVTISPIITHQFHQDFLVSCFHFVSRWVEGRIDEEENQPKVHGWSRLSCQRGMKNSRDWKREIIWGEAIDKTVERALLYFTLTKVAIWFGKRTLMGIKLAV